MAAATGSAHWVVKPEAVILDTVMGTRAVDPSAVDVIIYHADCIDGFAAAFSAWLRLGDVPTYVPLQHGPGLTPPDLAGKRVVVLDFSFNEGVTQACMEATRGAFLVLDHHASAQAALEGLPEANKVFEMRQSGATLAWNFFHPGTPVPLLLRYVEDRDIWRWAMRDSEAFSAGFGLVDKTFQGWKELVEEGEAGIERLIGAGRAVLAYQHKVRDGHVKRSRPTRLAGALPYIGLVCNGSTLASDIGNAMCQVDLPSEGGSGVEGGAPLPPRVQFGAIYEYDVDKRAFRVSLRSDSDEVDVSLMAKVYGGGGHRRAAGFTYTGASIEDILLPVGGLPEGWRPEPAGAAAGRAAAAQAAAAAAVEPSAAKKARTAE